MFFWTRFSLYIFLLCRFWLSHLLPTGRSRLDSHLWQIVADVDGLGLILAYLWKRFIARYLWSVYVSMRMGVVVVRLVFSELRGLSAWLQRHWVQLGKRIMKRAGFDWTTLAYLIIPFSHTSVQLDLNFCLLSDHVVDNIFKKLALFL